MNRGLSLIELLMVVAVIGILTAAGIGPLWRFVDRLQVHRAVNDVASFYREVRFACLLAQRPGRVEFGPDSLRGYLELSGRDSLIRVTPGPIHRGVSMTGSRSMIRFYSTGVGLGAANVSLVFNRGAAHDTLVTSRVGRLRRSDHRLQPSRE